MRLVKLTPLFFGFAVAACGMDGVEDDSIGELQGELSSVSIGNAGFESDWSGWTRYGSTGLTGVTHGGSNAAKVSASTGQVKRTVSGLKGGTKYTLSAYVEGYARIGARKYNGTSTTSKSIQASSWTKVSVTFTTGSSTTSVEIYGSWVSGGDARIDDFSLTADSTSALSGTCSYPAQLLDLSDWKLQLPTGDPVVEIKNPQLATYQHSTYFKNDSGCNAVRFRTPTNGTTTPGAEYPRTELREMDGSDRAEWSTTSGTHRMIIDQAVTHLPDGRRQIGVGQIHNGSSEIIIVKVEGSELLVKPNGKSAVVLDSNYQLGERFKIELVASGGTIKVYYNGNQVYSMSKSSSTAFFKAGAYPQTNCETEARYGKTCSSSNYGEVAIYDLVVRH